VARGWPVATMPLRPMTTGRYRFMRHSVPYARKRPSWYYGTMAKDQDRFKGETKKKAASSLKEKRKAKQEKAAGKRSAG